MFYIKRIRLDAVKGSYRKHAYNIMSKRIFYRKC